MVEKNFFFTVLYKNPTITVGTTAFTNFIVNFDNIYTNIKNERPYTMFLWVISIVTRSISGLPVTPLPKGWIKIHLVLTSSLLTNTILY